METVGRNWRFIHCVYNVVKKKKRNERGERMDEEPTWRGDVNTSTTTARRPSAADDRIACMGGMTCHHAALCKL